MIIKKESKENKRNYKRIDPPLILPYDPLAFFERKIIYQNKSRIKCLTFQRIESKSNLLLTFIIINPESFTTQLPGLT
jgi:hypothetical protein